MSAEVVAVKLFTLFQAGKPLAFHQGSKETGLSFTRSPQLSK